MDTYSAHVLSKDGIVFAILLFQMGELFRVKRLGLAHKTNTAEGKSYIVGCRQLFNCLELFEQILTDGRVGTVGADEDVAIVGGVV